MESCLYRGWVEHRRFAPAPHRFRYSVFHVYLDLAELDRVFDGIPLFSAKRPALGWFRRADHVGEPAAPLDAAIRDLVARETGQRPAGPIRLLTHLRYFGYVMNPVSFYYCYDRAGATVEAIVAEITNTPWGERHCYVLGERANLGSASRKRYRFDKSFHVSPFMGMDLVYDWSFRVPGERLTVHMKNLVRAEAGERLLFDATMSLERRPLSAFELYRCMAHHPFMTGKVVAAIYWQALRLWLEGTPYFPHPRLHTRQRP